MDPITIALSLAQFAPAVLRFFGAGDKPAAVAEKVIEVAKKVTGYSTPEEARAAMVQDAELAQKFNLAILAANTELEQAYLVDRQNARARDVEFLKAGRKNERGDNLAYLAVLSLVGCLICLFAVDNLPPANEKLLYLVVGALIVIVKDVYGFEFGSSKDSQRNAQAVADMAKGA